MGIFSMPKTTLDSTRNWLGTSIFNLRIFSDSIVLFSLLFSLVMCRFHTVVYFFFSFFFLKFKTTSDAFDCNSFKAHKQLVKMSSHPSINSFWLSLLGVKCSWEKSGKYFTPIFNRHQRVSDQMLFSLRIEFASSIALSDLGPVWIRLHNNSFLPMRFLPNFASSQIIANSWIVHRYLTLSTCRGISQVNKGACLSIIFILEVVYRRYLPNLIRAHSWVHFTALC